jgi:glutamate dehydrogenase (NADP+)
MFKHNNLEMEGKTAVISGSGNVALYAAKKAIEKGVKILAMSDSSGYVVDENGIDADLMIKIKEEDRKRISEYIVGKPNAKYVEGWEGIWDVKCDIAMPCATQNDIDLEKAKKLKDAGTKFIVEGANMPTTNDAMEFLLENGVFIGPAKAANAGGVSTSALEMAQNSMKYPWTFEKVDRKLKGIMIDIHKNSVAAAAEYGFGYNLVAGANIAGFKKVAEAMIMQGIY